MLRQIYAREYPGEGKGKGEAILKNKSARNYLQAMFDEGQRDPGTRDAALRLAKKLNDHPDFRQAVGDAFVASSAWREESTEARQQLAENPYLQSPS